MARKSAKTPGAIVEAAAAVVRRKGAVSLTIDAVAQEAGCAKGLVHYHLKTKHALLDAVARRIAEDRIAIWTDAFRAPTPRDAIRQTWNVLTTESENGTVRGWISLLGSGALSTETASDILSQFTAALGRAASALLLDLRLEPRVEAGALGWLLGAVIEGMGVQIIGGASTSRLEEAYAAAWLGILELTRSTT